jgi:DNA-binding transcriptional LysR family regulator
MDKTIKYVLEVARCGGIAKAARNLFITPSALSKYIIQKEDELGVKLFARDGNKFTLTYPGERYVEMLREAENLQEKMNREMARLADLYSGRLRIGIQMSFAELMIRGVLPALQDEYPNIRIFMEEAGNNELMKMLKKNQLDVILSLSEDKDESLRYDKLLESPIVVAAAKDSPLCGKAENKPGFTYPWISDKAIMEESIILDREGRSFRRYADYLLNLGKAPLHSDITITNARTALLCVEQDLGIIIIPEIIVTALHYKNRLDLYSFGAYERFSALFAISDSKSVLVNEVQTFGKIAREITINQKVDKS